MELLNNILIADGGATKTHWYFQSKENTAKRFITGGINPFFRTAEDIENEWGQSPIARLPGKVERVFFYGSGIINDKKAQVIKQALLRFFPKAETAVYGDLLAAARATLGGDNGIACILGTGSNSCQYDGKKITAHVPPLGYILGDEGSGANLGMQLVGDYLKKIMPPSLREKFHKKYPMEYPEFLNRVYHEDRPNRFLAGFVPFLTENIKNSYCTNLVENAFSSFIARNVSQYEGCHYQPVCFVGSVAFYFQEQLKQTLLKNNLVLGTVLKEPLSGLLKFHLNFSV